MGRIGWPELLMIAGIILILFGTKSLPAIGRSLGNVLKGFRKAGRDFREEIEHKDKNGEKNF